MAIKKCKTSSMRFEIDADIIRIGFNGGSARYLTTKEARRISEWLSKAAKQIEVRQMKELGKELKTRK